MMPLYIWLIVMVLLVIIEIFTETFYVLCLAIGALVLFFGQLVVPYTGNESEYLLSQHFFIEAFIFIFVSGLSMFFIPKWLKTQNEIKTGLEQSVGKKVKVVIQNDMLGIKHQGQFWRISEQSGDMKEGDEKIIDRFSGTKVVLK